MHMYLRLKIAERAGKDFFKIVEVEFPSLAVVQAADYAKYNGILSLKAETLHHVNELSA